VSADEKQPEGDAEEPLDVEEVEPAAGLEDGKAEDGVEVGDAAAPEAEPLTASSALVPQDSLGRYLAEIRRYPLLTPEEEHALAVRYHEHDDVEAAYRLVTANLRLVVMVARRYERAFRNLLDLVQEGNIGLMEAVKKFDPYRGIRFPSYAVWWIRAYVIRYIMNNFRLVKMGTTQAQRKLFFNLRKEMDRLEEEGFEATPKLIASRLDVKPSEVVEMQQRMAARDLSVDTPIGEDGDASMLDRLATDAPTTEDAVADAHYQTAIAQKMREFGETLSGKDKTIFEERLLAENPKTLAEIGESFGVSRERVRQIEERLKNRLKAYLTSEIEDLEEIEVVRRPPKRAGKRPAAPGD
jgi:RNA polymerase sigma-32 factor